MPTFVLGTWRHAWMDRLRARRSLQVARVWRIVLSPGTVVGVTYIPILVLYAFLSHYTRASDFLTIGLYRGTAAGVRDLVQGRSTYDAQFAYYMARFPGQNPPHAYDDAVIRWSRMLQPLLVRIVTAGNVDLMPWAFLAINVLSVAIGTAFLGHLLAQQGRSRWIALAYGFYAGIQVAVFRDVADPLAILWLIVAVWGLRRGSPLQTAAALGFALLTRETLLMFVPLLLVPLALRRRWAELAWSGAIALIPFGIWQVALRLWLGKWGLLESEQVNHFARLPFSGAVHAYLAPQFGLVIAFAVIPTILIWIIAASDIWERGVLTSLMEPLAVATLLYSVALSFQNLDHWRDIWASGRLLAPVIPLVLLLTPRRLPWVRSGLVSVLLVSGCIVAFNVVWG